MGKKIFFKIALIIMIINVVLPIVSFANNEDENVTKDEYTEENIGVEYSSHVQDFGWEEDFSKSNGEQSGTTGKNKKLEAMKIRLVNANSDAEIRYSLYVEGQGWQNEVSNGEVAGTTGKNLKMLGIKINLVNLEKYSVMYRIHVEDFGWKDWVYDGEETETIKDQKKIEAIEIKLIEKKPFGVYYNSHVENNGWEEDFCKSDAQESGTTGQNLKIEAIKIRLFGNAENTGIRYRAYVENNGWEDWKYNGEMTGTTGKNLKMLGIKIELVNMDTYSVQYRVHMQDYGWSDWVVDGQTVGAIADEKKIEAIEISIVEKTINTQKSISYMSFVENQGWEEEYLHENGEISGSTGKNLKLLGLKVKLQNYDEGQNVLYRVHVENYGWLDWVKNGEETGKIPEESKIEAIQIKLENMEEYTVEYRAHVQDYGWQDWMIDGESAGTTGENKKIEAIQIRIVPKYKRSYKGIDVSKHNGTIDWQKVKNSGIEFAIIRCGYGQNLVEQDDSKFEYNVSECERLGIPYGVYLYSYALNTDNASSEADHVLRLLNGRKPQVGIWIDIEDDAYYTKYGFPTNEMFVNIATTFCEKMKANGYYNVGIYANLYWLNTRLNDSRLDQYDKWVAQWGNQCTYNKDYAMWQYSDNGTVDGISGNVDLDICYKRFF